jgi:hypothetical protein
MKYGVLAIVLALVEPSSIHMCRTDYGPSTVCCDAEVQPDGYAACVLQGDTTYTFNPETSLVTAHVFEGFQMKLAQNGFAWNGVFEYKQCYGVHVYENFSITLNIPNRDTH